MAPIRLRAVQTPAKVLLPSSAKKAAPIFFVLMHGFLAHSGAMNSFAVLLRNAIDSHNLAILKTSDQTSATLPFHITTLDARNHGLSPHTSIHSLESCVEDLRQYLSHDFPRTVSQVSGTWMQGRCGDITNHDHGDAAGPRVIAVGHSMGSMTWTKYLMDCYIDSPVSNEKHQGLKGSPTSAASLPNQAFPAAQPSLDVKGLVSLDFPPIVRSRMTAKLTGELIDIIEHMKAVDLSAITDLRSGQEEFYRCGLRDIRVRGLCSTNLALHVHPGDPTRRTASWKCNVPVLEHAIRSGEIFLPDSYYKEAAEGNRLGDAHCLRQRQQQQRRLALENPSVGRVPLLSVLGAASPIGGSPQYQELWERYAVDLRQHTILDATHTVYFDKPRETIQLIMEFLNEIRVV